jgi:hypothetical protein
MLDPRPSENMDQGRARARRPPVSSSPDHRKQIRKVGRIRLAHKVHLDDVIHKLLVDAQAENSA